MLDRIQEFQSVKHVALDGKICWNAFELKSYKNLLTPMKDKTKQIEIQAHIFQKSSIIVERFPVITSHMRKPDTLVQWHHRL